MGNEIQPVRLPELLGYRARWAIGALGFHCSTNLLDEEAEHFPFCRAVASLRALLFCLEACRWAERLIFCMI
jgi:hypothetical protein